MNAAIRTRHPTVNTRPPRRAVLRVSGDCRFSNILMRVETMTLLVRLARRRVAREWRRVPVDPDSGEPAAGESTSELKSVSHRKAVSY